MSLRPTTVVAAWSMLGASLRAASPPSDIVTTSRIEFLNAPPVWVIVLVIAPALLLLCRWLYVREPLVGRGRWGLATLRGLALALLLLFLFHPVRLEQRVRVERPVGVLLVDDSASLRERDMAELARDQGLSSDATRTDVVRSVLAAPVTGLGERYELLTFAFGENLRALADLSDLAAGDASTRLGDALAALGAETRGRDLAQVVLVSDGRVNAGRDVQAALGALEARGIPINTIGVGDPDVPADLRLGTITAPEVALAGDTVTLEVSIAARGYPGAAAQLTVTDTGSQAELARESIALAEGDGLTEQVVRIGFVPQVEGELDLRIQVEPLPGERDTANNADRRLLRVEPGRIKVLYVDGYPRYEYRFLKNSLLRVANMELQCLLLSADKDFVQESSANVPSLTRFPPTLEDLLEYHVIIFGDVDPNDPGLGADSDVTLGNIKSFVEAGGGFLMQAGNLHSPRDYVGTPIAEILPVLVGDLEVERGNMVAPGEPFRPVLTRPRDPHEIVTLENDVDRNTELWQEEQGLAALTWYHPVAKARTTADVLLVHPFSRNVHGPHVLLSTMYYPQGRTAFLATDETWRWRFYYGETYREPFWRGLVRFLALNRLRRSDYGFDLSTDRSAYDIGDRVLITARVRDPKTLDPLAAATFDVTVVQPDGRRDTIALPREEDGVFSGSVVVDEPGPYRLWLEDADDATAEPKSPRVVNVTVPSVEQDDPVLDESFLRSLALRTGGRYARLEDADDLFEALADPVSERPLDEPEREEVWAGWTQLLLLTALLAGEWIARKRSNLV